MGTFFIAIITLLLRTVCTTQGIPEPGVATETTTIQNRLLSSLSTVVLANKQNITVNSTILGPASAAHSVSIFACSINGVNENALQAFPNITDFSFSQNSGVNMLPKNIFHANGYLENIYLIGDNLTSIAEETFATSLYLRHLDLSINKIAVLPSRILSSCIMLRKIFMQRNELKELPEGIFDNASQLKLIDLSFNRIKKIPSSLFKYNYQLESVILEGNKLKHLDYGIEHLHVRTFYLHANPLDMENKKIVEILKFLHVHNVKTGIHLPHHKQNVNVQHGAASASPNYLLIVLISVTVLLSVLVGYLIYVVKVSKQSNCMRYHNMQTLSREDLVAGDPWAETEINGNVVTRTEN